MKRNLKIKSAPVILRLDPQRRYMRSSLVIFHDYFERTTDGIIGADKLAQSAPLTFVHIDNTDSAIFNHQGATSTDADTQTTALAFISVY
jgi:hypothetical protein